MSAVPPTAAKLLGGGEWQRWAQLETYRILTSGGRVGGARRPLSDKSFAGEGWGLPLSLKLHEG